MQERADCAAAVSMRCEANKAAQYNGLLAILRAFSRIYTAMDRSFALILLATILSRQRNKPAHSAKRRIILKMLDHLFERNAQWAAGVKQEDPDFFENLFRQQTPEYLWIGCSDSRVPANALLDIPPGEVFVHRNIANVVVHTDLNCLSVIQFAVDVLRVKHIIVCGHYGCGGVIAAMDNKEHGLIDNWLRHIEDVARFNVGKLENLDHDKMLDTMCELNVTEQVANVCHTSTVQRAWRNRQELSVHGWIYSIKDGILKDLNTTLTSNEELAQKQARS